MKLKYLMLIEPFKALHNYNKSGKRKTHSIGRRKKEAKKANLIKMKVILRIWALGLTQSKKLSQGVNIVRGYLKHKMAQ